MILTSERDHEGDIRAERSSDLATKSSRITPLSKTFSMVLFYWIGFSIERHTRTFFVSSICVLIWVTLSHLAGSYGMNSDPTTYLIFLNGLVETGHDKLVVDLGVLPTTTSSISINRKAAYTNLESNSSKRRVSRPKATRAGYSLSVTITAPRPSLLK